MKLPTSVAACSLRLLAVLTAVAGLGLVRSADAACIVPPTGVVAWWPGDGDGSDRNGLTPGSAQNGASFSAGLVAQAFDLDGSDDYVSFVNRRVADLIHNEFTIEWWANPGGTSDRPTWGFAGSSSFNALNPIASYDGGLTFGNGTSHQLMSPLRDIGNSCGSDLRRATF